MFPAFRSQLSRESSRGGLEVELWTASMDQIPLGAMYLYGSIWTCYIYKVYRCVLYVCVSCKAAYSIGKLRDYLLSHVKAKQYSFILVRHPPLTKNTYKQMPSPVFELGTFHSNGQRIDTLDCSAMVPGFYFENLLSTIFVTIFLDFVERIYFTSEIIIETL